MGDGLKVRQVALADHYQSGLNNLLELIQDRRIRRLVWVPVDPVPAGISVNLGSQASGNKRLLEGWGKKGVG